LFVEERGGVGVRIDKAETDWMDGKKCALARKIVVIPCAN